MTTEAFVMVEQTLAGAGYEFLFKGTAPTGERKFQTPVLFGPGFMHAMCFSSVCRELMNIGVMSYEFSYDRRDPGTTSLNTFQAAFNCAMQRCREESGEWPIPVVHSACTKFAIRYMLEHPKRVPCLFLLAPLTPRGAARPVTRALYAHPLAVGYDILRGNVTGVLELLIKNPEVVRSLFFAPSTPNTVISGAMNGMLVPESARILRALLMPWSLPPRIECDITILWATHDRLIALGALGAFCEKLIRRGATVAFKEIPGGHDFFLEHPWLVAQLIHKKMKELKQGGIIV